MLFLLRKIRNKMIKESKFGQYLLYAIGEIILVVVGILIAVQIDNWNETIREKSIEQRTLTELKLAIMQDTSSYNKTIRYGGIKLESTKRLARALNNGIEDYDSIRIDLVNSNFTYFFSFNSGPYETFKSIGLDKISNDSIRNSITYIYGKLLPDTETYFNEIARELIQKNRQIFEKNVLTVTVLKDNDWSHFNYEWHSDEFITKKELSTFVSNQVYITKGYISRISFIVEELEALLLLLDSNLPEEDNI